MIIENALIWAAVTGMRIGFAAYRVAARLDNGRNRRRREAREDWLRKVQGW